MTKRSSSEERRKKCQRCGYVPKAAREISRRGYCPDCSEAALREATEGLATRQGPAYEKWRKAMAEFAQEVTSERES